LIDNSRPIRSHFGKGELGNWNSGERDATRFLTVKHTGLLHFSCVFGNLSKVDQLQLQGPADANVTCDILMNSKILQLELNWLACEPRGQIAEVDADRSLTWCTRVTHAGEAI